MVCSPDLTRVPDGSSEPVITDWVPVEVDEVLARLGVLDQGRTRVLAVNGRSGSGKSTLAARLASAVPESAVVATDDVAWNFSMFDWAEELIKNVIEPVRRGAAVDYRPPGWVEHDRPGSVRVDSGRSLLIIEGVGAGQQAMVEALDAAIWVQSDVRLARERGLARDVELGVNGDLAQATEFWDSWMASENPFLEADRPWLRADVIMSGNLPGTGGRLLKAAGGRW